MIDDHDGISGLQNITYSRFFLILISIHYCYQGLVARIVVNVIILRALCPTEQAAIPTVDKIGTTLMSQSIVQ